jgi:GntR family transcriptional repressor for pyruvate dehydrogenase complex
VVSSREQTKSRPLSDKVFERIGRDILEGRSAPGTALAPERRLAEQFGVNRHVVREALKRLAQLGLIRIAQGGGTTVLDYRKHAGLDLLALLAEYPRGGEDVAHYWLAVLEMRAAIASDAAGLCARRAAPELRQEIAAIARRLADAPRGEGQVELHLLFWERVLEGSGNVAYRLAFNTTKKAALADSELAAQWSSYELKKSNFLLPVAEAIAAGDAKRAEAETRAGLRSAIEGFTRRFADALPPGFAAHDRRPEPSTARAVERKRSGEGGGA